MNDQSDSRRRELTVQVRSVLGKRPDAEGYWWVFLPPTSGQKGYLLRIRRVATDPEQAELIQYVLAIAEVVNRKNGFDVGPSLQVVEDSLPFSADERAVIDVIIERIRSALP